MQAVVPGVAGTWKDLTDSVNAMGTNLTAQVRNIAEVTTAVARGDLSRKITVDVKGEILELKDTINTMVDQLNAFAAEVTRVAREVGTEGKLGGQGQVSGVAGTWKDLTDSVNVMAANLTDQVRGIVKVVTAVATGNLRQKLTVQAKGEVAALAETINNMTDTLATFADQVTNVAREVGVEGRLGGQANVPGAAGTWRDLTANVNLLAANLTTQVRAIAEVATAVTKGDMTRSIQVDARGEVAELKDNINTMIDNLRVTTERNEEQDWLKTNVAKFTRMLQGQRDLFTVGENLLSELAPLINAQQGTFYQMTILADGAPTLRRLAGYANPAGYPDSIALGEGLVGQCAKEKQRILLSDVPPGYAPIRSSLGNADPASVVVLPVLFEGQTKAVVEFASLRPFTECPPEFPRAADPIDWCRAQHDRGHYAHGEPARAEPAAHRRAPKRPEGTPANERRTRTKGPPACRAKRRGRAQERRDRAGPKRTRGEGCGTRAHFQIQVRVPREHVARVAHTAKLDPHPRPAARAKRGRQPRTEASRLRAQHSLRRFRLVEPHQRHSRSFENRVWHGHRRDRRHQLRVAQGIRRTQLPPCRRQQEPAIPRRVRIGTPNIVHERSETPSSDHQEPALECLQVHLAGRSHDESAARERWLEHGPSEPWTLGKRHRHCHPRHAVSVSRRRSRGSSSKRSSKRMPARRANTAARVLVLRFRVNWHRCSAAKSGSRANLVRAVFSHCSFPSNTPVPPAPRPRLSLRHRIPAKKPCAHPIAPIAREEKIPDDRESVREGDLAVLVVEDDPHYARVLLGLARDNGFKGLVATRGHEAIALARQYRPTVITLDIFLPDMLGWTVLNNLKLAPETRHIPVQIITLDEERRHGLSRGAFAYLVKPATTEDLESAFERLKTFSAPRTKRLLVVEDNDIERQSIVELLGNDDIEIVSVDTGADAFSALLDRPFDCCVLDLRLPDMTGFELLDEIQAEQSLREIPIVVFTGKDLTAEEKTRLDIVAKSVVLKDVRSPERLLDETALFLHRVVSELPPHKQEMLRQLHESSEVLRGKKVLVVDDDARNIFALSIVLENQDMEILTATNGRQAIEIIKSTPDLSIVLMDIMMPEMDGYETMREIRKVPEFRPLPILALTAKAMKGRDSFAKCFFSAWRFALRG